MIKTWRDFNDQFRESTWERNERQRKRRLQKAVEENKARESTERGVSEPPTAGEKR